ncbi:MAG: Peroxide-responsive repressor PerR [Candidatus Marinimicrobia bacterium]|nr:Peroxide-responsive repressor PerR [Candidatus Neomarinimicrobiota bacterium]
MVKERYSKQREAIFNVVMSTDTHPTAEWVYETVREELSSISLGTVYRNLNYLVRKRKIRELNLADDVARYDGNKATHFHYICTECNTIYDMDYEAGDFIESVSERLPGFTVNSHKLELYGTCQQCETE